MQCYLNLLDSDQSIIDYEGVAVTDVDQARRLALNVAAEMLREGEADAADWRGWRLEAVDASGAALFMVRLDALAS
jgi:hypothetical protein